MKATQTKRLLWLEELTPYERKEAILALLDIAIECDWFWVSNIPRRLCFI
jgi:hypothetical protein